MSYKETFGIQPSGSEEQIQTLSSVERTFWKSLRITEILLGTQRKLGLSHRAGRALQPVLVSDREVPPPRTVTEEAKLPSQREQSAGAQVPPRCLKGRGHSLARVGL